MVVIHYLTSLKKMRRGKTRRVLKIREKSINVVKHVGRGGGALGRVSVHLTANVTTVALNLYQCIIDIMLLKQNILK